MHFGVLGDIHGDFGAVNTVMRRHQDAAFWLSVGDVASADLRYPEPVSPLYWIQGNNEDFAVIADLAAGMRPPSAASPNLHFLPNGTATRVLDLTIAALGGTFAPTWYETAAGDLPPAGRQGRRGGAQRDDKRRHFVREQVEALKAQRGVDVLLTHEAPRPFFVQAGARRLDAGKTAVNEVLAATRPRLHFFGHHHRFADQTRDAVRSIGLDLVSHSYVLVDGRTFEVTKVDF
jgi:hypothetical protein